MTQKNIIKAILTGWNNIEQMGIFEGEMDVRDWFGDGAEISEGEKEPGASYLYLYDERLYDGSWHDANFTVKDSAGQTIFLYRLD